MSFFGRLGSEEMKFQISLTILRVETTSSSDPLAVRFTRGAKTAITPPIMGRSGTYDFTRTASPLSLYATLYRKKDKYYFPRFFEFIYL